MRDFEGRCAYSMQHQERAGAMEIDHFDPRRKADLIREYSNLFLASRHCNGKKGDHWPTREAAAAGCRFLNPCEEMDYGEQIFEDAVTYQLIGTTPAARWHIRICGLNADHLIRQREKRAKYWKLLKKTRVVSIKQTFGAVSESIQKFKEEIELMIPEIPAKPHGARAQGGR